MVNKFQVVFCFLIFNFSLMIGVIIHNLRVYEYTAENEIILVYMKQIVVLCVLGTVDAALPKGKVCFMIEYEMQLHMFYRIPSVEILCLTDCPFELS